MKIGTPKEIYKGESRVAMSPDSARQLQKLGYECLIETGAGVAAAYSDASYKEVGVSIVDSAAALWDEADIIAKVRQPETRELTYLRANKTLISFFNPGENSEGMEAAKTAAVNVIAMEMVPRISRAQKMDALSSMANIAGYRAVIEAGNNFGRFFTGQVTAAGKVPPAKVLIVGAGVAGLAAIGPATSLGAITFAFDVRPEVAEQVEYATYNRDVTHNILQLAQGQLDGCIIENPSEIEAALAKLFVQEAGGVIRENDTTLICANKNLGDALLKLV